jgi:hypothetical protein
MKERPMKKTTSIAFSCALLAACGGGGGGTFSATPAPPAVPGSDVPVAATQDPVAAYQFVASVAATSSDSADPINVGDATLATSDTDEPMPL